MKIILSHPTGNSNVKYALEGLLHYGLLSSFHTSIASFPNNFWGRLSKIKGLSEFSRRAFNADLERHTHTHPYKELGRIVSTKLQLSYLLKHEKGIFSIDKAYDYIDKCTAKEIYKHEFDAIYSYEDGALASFTAAKYKGITCLYDLPIGYWRAGRLLLQTEKDNRPDWANTLGGFKDSDIKLERKDNELALADHIFVASSFTKKTLSHYPNKLAEVSVIPYGFPDVYEDRQYSSIKNRKLKLLFVGGLSQRKGIANILEAVAFLGNYVELTIIGHKTAEDCVPLNEGLKKHCWIPTLNHAEILKQMRDHDVLLFPSLFEGFGLVITEAMSQGTPVITTNRTAGVDLIQHRENGWIVEPGNTLDLIRVIKNILDNPDELQNTGTKALETAKIRPWVKYGEDLCNAIVNLKLTV